MGDSIGESFCSLANPLDETVFRGFRGRQVLLLVGGVFFFKGNCTLKHLYLKSINESAESIRYTELRFVYHPLEICFIVLKARRSNLVEQSFNCRYFKISIEESPSYARTKKLPY